MTTLVAALPAALRGRASGKSKKIKMPTWLPRVIVLGAVGLVIAMTVVYVLQVNRISERGFEVRALEQRIRVLKEDGSRLEAELRTLESLTSLEARIQSLQMVRAGEIRYAAADAPAVAAR